MSDDPPLHVEAVGDFLRCPTRYRFEYETPLSGDDEPTDDGRVELLRTVICDAIRKAIRDDVDFLDAVSGAFADEWSAYADEADHHSRHQYEYDHLVVRKGIEDFWENHFDLEEVAAVRENLDWSVVGPNLGLDVDFGGGRRYRVTVDYLRAVDGKLDAVCVTDTLESVGLRYPNMNIFEKHFEGDKFYPKAATRMFESYLTEQWLDAVTSDTSYEPGSLYYAGVLHNHARAGDGVRVESEWRAMPVQYDCSDMEILDRLRTVRNSITEKMFDPTTFFGSEGFDALSFDDVAQFECRDCAYRSGCEHRIRKEVRFDE